MNHATYTVVPWIVSLICVIGKIIIQNPHFPKQNVLVAQHKLIGEHISPMEQVST